jgi:hypothetical protein
MNSKLNEAITVIKAGDKKQGYRLLVEVIKAGPSSEEAELAWLWMSVAVTDIKKKRQSLETVLKINPNNGVAQESLAKLDSAIQVSQPSREQEPLDTTLSAANLDQSTKQCPYCDETIKARAKVCRYCGYQLENLPGATLQGAAQQRILPNPTQSGNTGSDVKDVGKTTAGVALGILSAPIVAVIILIVVVTACCVLLSAL